MYQKVRIAMIIGLLLPMAWAQAVQPKVAVLGFRNGHTVAKYATAGESLRDQFEQRLVESRRFVMVEREQLAGLLNEKDLARADMINDPYGIARRLKGSEVDYLVTGSVEGDEDFTTATARFISVSGDQAGTLPYSVRAVGYSIGGVNFLAYDLAQQAKACFPITGQVTAVNGHTVEFDLGREQGVWIGDEFSVTQERNVRDKVRREDIARVRVVDVHPDFALGEMSWADDRVKREMTIVSVAPRLASEPYVGRRTVTIAAPKAQGPGVEKWQTGAFGDGLEQGIQSGATPLGVPTVASGYAFEQCLAEVTRCQRPDFDWTRYTKPSFLSPYYLVTSSLEQTEGGMVAHGNILEAATTNVVASCSVKAADISAAAQQLAQALTEELRKKLEADDFKVPQAGLVNAGFRINYSTIPARGCNVILPRLYSGLVDYSFQNLSNQPVRLRVTTDVPDYGLLPRSEIVRLAPRGEGLASQIITQNPLLQSTLLEPISKVTDARIACSVELLTDAGAVPVLNEEKPLRILPANLWTTNFGQAPEVRMVGDEQRTLASIAAWVEDTPALRAIMARTPQGQRADSMIGYQNSFLAGPLPTDNYEQKAVFVREQVKAVYEALQAEGVKYLEASAVAFPPSEAQRVLPPDEVLRNRAGNCLELSLLFASILRGTIETAIVITDNHAFLAWHTWSNEDAPWDVLETTVIGSDKPGPANIPVDFDTACERARTKYPQIAKALRGKVVFSNALGTLVEPAVTETGARAIINAWTASGAFSSIGLERMAQGE